MANPSTRELRVGLIGKSGHSSVALNIIARRPDLKLSAYAPSHPSEPASLQRPGFDAETRFYDSPTDMLEEASLDILIVDSVFGLHATYALQGIQRGLAVLLEKPAATSLEELELLEKAVKEAEVPLACMFFTRTHPYVLLARQLVRNGGIGEVRLVWSQKTYKLGRRPSWFNDRKLYGGTIPWVAIHALDWVRFITGLEYVNVSATQAYDAPQLPNLETSGALQLGLANGGVAAITFDYLRPAGAPTHGDDRFRIVGTRGSIEARLDEGYFALTDEVGVKTSWQFPQELNIFLDLVEAVQTGRPLRFISTDALPSTRAALAAREAADTGRMVSI